MGKVKISARIELCRCINGSGPYELWILNNSKGYFQLKEHISFKKYQELIKDSRYEIRVV